MTVQALLGIPDVELVGILLDVERPSLPKRFRSLRRNILREGPSYLWYRAGSLADAFLRGLEQRLIPRKEVDTLLHTAFPDRVFSLSDLRIPIYPISNLNSSRAVKVLQSLRVDLGVVCGTRVLTRRMFSIPRLGCINLHKGKVPEYRGQPPGFWEIYDGLTSASVMVHFIDDGLDTGDVVNSDSVPISPHDSPETLRLKLNDLGARLLRQCVGDFAQGLIERSKQPAHSCKTRTFPTRLQRQKVDKRLGLTPEGPWRSALKSFFALFVFCSGLFHFLHFLHRRGRIILYHRVNDLVQDSLTISVRQFAEQMLLLNRFYSVVPTAELVAKVRSGHGPPKHAIAIHFDDCYKDVVLNAAPILSALGLSSCIFVSSGFVGTHRTFAHDAACPFVMRNLDRDDLLDWLRRGFEVGSHTVNHVDLAACDYDQAADEVGQSKAELEKLLGSEISMMSFPFGKPQNIRAEAIRKIREAGYQSLFSAYGGDVTKNTNPFNMQRKSGSGEVRPFVLLMRIEGLSSQVLRRIGRGPILTCLSVVPS
jgi:peptidoglycan/xylan/chitin deacetylase (PgdA/CDA1 family)